MKILNPLYDWSFKYLMDNNDLAKKFLSAILKQNVSHLETRNIELPLLKEGNPFITRFDFKAIIEIETGGTEEVLIEIQKYRNPDPINRFRTYLGENYMKKESYKDEQGKAKIGTLPLIAIYILGYCPKEFSVPYIIIRNKIYDGVDEREMSVESTMVKQLTHKAYIIIVDPPKDYVWRGSRQEAIIRLFRQKLTKEERNTVYELEEEPEDEVAKKIANYLSSGTKDEIIIKQLQAEDEYYESIGDLEIELEELKQREEEERRQKEEERRQKAKIQEESAKEFLKLGLSIEKISQLTSLSKEYIEKLK